MAGLFEIREFPSKYGKKNKIVVSIAPATENSVCYEYSLHYTGRNASTWRCNGCIELKKLKTPGALISTVKTTGPENARQLADGEDPFNPKHAHLCQPRTLLDPLAKEVQRKAIRSIAKAPLNHARTVYRNSFTAVNHSYQNNPDLRDAIKGKVQDWNAAKSSLHRSAGKSMPNVPSLDQIPAVLQTTLTNERFVIHSQRNPDMLIVASPQSLLALSIAEDIVADGTFKFAPPEFHQMYIVFATVNDHSCVAAVALLHDKTAATYENMLQVIEQNLPQGSMGNAVLHIDCEMAMVRAWHNTFPQSAIVTCWFHFCKSVIANVKLEGLYALYQQNAQGNHPDFSQFPYTEFRVWVRRVLSLAFVPAEMVWPVFDTYLAWQVPFVSNELNPSCIRLRNYICHQWFGIQGPPFGQVPDDSRINLWNQFKNLGPRTTNFAEAFNGALKDKFPNKHPEIKKLLFALRVEFDFVQPRLIRVLAGRQPPRQRSVTVRRADAAFDAAKVRWQQEFDQQFGPNNPPGQVGTWVIGYLDQIAHNISNKF